MIRKIVLGCAGLVVFLIAATVLLGVFFGPRLVNRGKQWFDAQFAEAKRINDFQGNWQPPGSNLDEAWFPPVIGEWKRVGQVETARRAAGLESPQAGRTAVYERSSDKARITVTALPASEQEKGVLLASAKAQFERSSGSKYSTSMAERLYLRRNGREHTRFWWLQNWLFVFETAGAEDPEKFMDQYLTAIDAAAKLEL